MKLEVNIPKSIIIEIEKEVKKIKKDFPEIANEEILNIESVITRIIRNSLK